MTCYHNVRTKPLTRLVNIVTNKHKTGNGDQMCFNAVEIDTIFITVKIINKTNLI